MRTNTIFKGRFQPTERGDLPGFVRDLIGSRHRFQVSNRIGVGKYRGRFACVPIDENGKPSAIFQGFVIPDCDILIDEFEPEAGNANAA